MSALRRLHHAQQHGAALITAMLLAALITVLAASWLARFDTHLRVTDVQRMGTQARWLLRAATDWARMIVSEDDPSHDDLSETWAVPIAPIRMTDIAGAQEAFFSGRLNDAQALFNLHNVRPGGDAAILAVNLAWARALMQAQGLTGAQSQAWMNALQAIPDSQIATQQLLDSLPSGVSQQVVATLESVFVWLPTRTKVNINTVQIAVLAAHPSLNTATAQQWIAVRDKAAILSAENIANALDITPALASQFEVKTDYFLATGRLAVGRIDVMARSLMQRQGGSTPKLLWSMPL